jgi:hypothetical protein
MWALAKTSWDLFLHDPAAAITAASTAVIAFFTIVLVFVTGRQARLTRKAIELGNREFIATHRPRIRIREIETGGLAQQPHVATIRAANVGATEARVVAMGIDIFVGSPFDATPKPFQPPRMVAPGQELKLDVQGGRPLTATELQQIGARSMQLRLLGNHSLPRRQPY